MTEQQKHTWSVIINAILNRSVLNHGGAYNFKLHKPQLLSLVSVFIGFGCIVLTGTVQFFVIFVNIVNIVTIVTIVTVAT